MSQKIVPNVKLHGSLITFFIFLLSSFILFLAACSLSSDVSAQAPAPASPTPTPTSPPPPPQVAYTPVAPGTVSPIVVQRTPRRGEELKPGGVIELVFDRPMDRTATGSAFTLQTAEQQPRQIEGTINWPDSQGRTMRFTPNQALERAMVYDAILTQAATAADGAPLAEPFTFRFTTPGYLEVTQVIPADGTADVETNATITVMFNRPVVPLTSLAQAENFPQPVEFEPAITGQGEWLNTSIYVFKPEKPLAGGAAYTARVKSGLQDAAGQTLLPNDFQWSFTTQPPEVVFVSPNDGQTLVPIETGVQVTFNQSVDPPSAQANFSLSAGGLSGSVSGDFLIVDQTLTFTPTERLAFDTTYQVTIGAGVKSVAGGRGMVSPYSFSFTTVPLPKIVGTEPQNGDRAAYPYTDFRISFNAPINPDTVMAHVSMTPPLPITPTEVYTYYSPWDNTFSFSFGAKPSTDYEVRITPGIADPYGNTTQENLTVRFRTAPLDPNYQLRIPDLIGSYDAGLPAKMIVSFVNLSTLNLRLYRLDPQELLRPQWEWNEYRPPAGSLIREWQERLEAPTDKQSFQTIDLVAGGGALEPGLYFLETDSPQLPQENYYYYGHNHVLVVSKTNLTLKAGQRDALVWATDLAGGQPLAGLEITFYAEDRRLLDTATTDGEGIARLDLGQRPNRDSLLAAVWPDGQGQGFTAVSENWARGVSPYDFGLDVAYTLPSFTAHIYTDRSIYRPGQTVDFKGVLRAEDDVDFSLADVGQVHLMVRNSNSETIMDELVKLSPAGTFNGEIKLEEGAALGNYVIAIDFANQTQYFEQYFQVAAYRPPEFEVTVEPAKAELMRGQEVEAAINATYFFGGPLAGAEVSWNVLAESYRFDPAQLGHYSFDDTDDPYVCFDCWWWRQPSPPQPVLSGSGTTDASGQLVVKLDSQELDQALPSGSQRVIIEATVTGPDNQTISGRAGVILHKGEYYIGLSPQEYVADAGKETGVDLVAVDWAVERLANKELDVQIIRYEWVNTFVEEAGGGYWKSDTQQELVDEFTVTTDSQGGAVARFTPPKGGSYQVVAQDAATLTPPSPPLEGGGKGISKIRSSIFVWVAGDKSVSWRRENHDRITLISDKAEYTPGETAEILIPSPFAGEHEALVTIERGRIIQHQVIKMTSSSQIYKLPITENYAPNIYVSVVLVQGRTPPSPPLEGEGDASRLADYKVGILPIDVKPAAQLLKISLTPSVEQAQPGEEITYNIEATDVAGQPVTAAELSLDLVDKAVLSLLPRQPEAIVKAFYDRRGLGITTSSGLAVSANQFLLELAEDLGLDKDEFAQKAAGGVEEEMAGAPLATAEMPLPAAAPAEGMLRESVADSAVANQAPIPAGVEVREEFSDTAYWNPVVVTDEQGRAEVTLTLPDNLTTWVMRGVGVTQDTQVGEATAELVVTKPLLIRPVAPRFFVVDDQAQLAANLTNNTGADMEVEVTLAAKGLTISPDTPAVQTTKVSAHGETKVTWNVTVPDVITSELVFAAVSKTGDYNDAAKPRLTTGPDGSLLVLRYTAPDIVGTANQLVGGGSQTEVVALPPNTDTRRGELSVQLDPSLAAGMREGLTYLEHYPYECTEQTISRFLPNVLTYKALQSLGIENKELAGKLPGLVEEGLNKLYVQQKSDGGWGWWADDESNVHITAYVVFALTKAQQAGIDVSATVLTNGQNFLLNHLKTARELNTTFAANRHAFVLYALAEGNQAPADSLETLFDAREKLAHYGRAYLALALNLSDAQGYQANIQTLLSDLNNTAILSATGAHWEEANYDWWAMNTDTRSTAIILDTLARLDPDNALIPNVVRWLMVARKDGIWETTQETAWALIALTDWMVETGELEAAYDYSVSLNSTDLAEGTATKDNVQESIKLKVPIADLLLDAGNRLTIARTDGNGRLYYTAHLKVYLPVEEIEPAERGVIVSRRYRLESCLAEQAQDKNVVCSEVREAKLGDVIRVDLTIIAPNDLYYVVVEDPLPAGAEAIDTGLTTTSLLAMDPTLTRQSRVFLGEDTAYSLLPTPYFWWWRWYSRSELRDDKVVLFADYLPKGTYEYSYTIRATLPGDYHVIPTVASEFYFPEVFGRSDGRLLSIGQ